MIGKTTPTIISEIFEMITNFFTTVIEWQVSNINLIMHLQVENKNKPATGKQKHSWHFAIHTFSL